MDEKILLYEDIDINQLIHDCVLNLSRKNQNILNIVGNIAFFFFFFFLIIGVAMGAAARWRGET
jgi:hypothetical protein